jgi:ribonuclease P protein component
MPARFRPRGRLRTGAEFERVFKRGARHSGRLFLLVAAPNGRAFDRLGLAVSRRVGGAVARNRARRLLREGFRRLGKPAGPGADLVVVAHAEIVGRGQAEVDREIRERIRRIKRAPGLAGPGPAAGG